MTKIPMPPLPELIAQTPGAQTREQALASIKTRRQQLLGTDDAPQTDFTSPEPLPHTDPDAYAKGFFERQMAKETPPSRGAKPRLVIDNNNDDPEPPKAA